MTVPSGTTGEGEGVPPEMLTNPDVAFLDVFRTLTVDGRVRLAPDGRMAVTEVYNRNLGDFLQKAGSRFPTRDVWNDESLREFKSFILDDVILPIAHLARQLDGAGDGTTRPIGERPFKRAAYVVMTDENVVAECRELLRRLKLDEDGSEVVFATCPVCAAVRVLGDELGESQLE